MPLAGIAEFAEPYLLDRIYIDGTWVDHRPGYSQDLGPGCFPLPTHGGTHVFQRQYRGELKPKDKQVYQFRFPVRADGDAAWFALKKARAKCAPFYFTAGVRLVDTFPATSGNTYRLSRPLAVGIVPGIIAGDYPTIIELDGVEDPSAATVTGQNVVANDTGTITVIYTPVHLVYFSQFSETISEHNADDLDIVLDEILVS